CSAPASKGSKTRSKRWPRCSATRRSCGTRARLEIGAGGRYEPSGWAGRIAARHLRPGITRLGVTAQHRPSAVDGHGGAVDEAGIVSEQPGNGGRAPLGPPDAADRVQPAQLLLDPVGRRGLLAAEERLVALGGD